MQENVSTEETTEEVTATVLMSLTYSLFRNFAVCERKVSSLRNENTSKASSVFWRAILLRVSCPILCLQSCRRSEVFQSCVSDNNILCLWNVSSNKGVPFKLGLCKPVHGRLSLHAPGKAGAASLQPGRIRAFLRASSANKQQQKPE